MAEETIKPEKTVGKGILISLVAITGVFVLQTYVAALIQPDWQHVSAATGFFDAAELAGGEALKVALLVINILAVGVANIMAAQTAAARMLYGMGRDGVIPKVFAKIHPKYKTPYVGTIVIGVLSCALPLVLTLSQLVRLVNFGALSSFILLNIAVFVFFFIKEKRRKTVGDFVKYLICPILGVAILLFVFSGFEKLTYIIGFVWLALGIVIGAIKSKGFKEVPEAFKNMEKGFGLSRVLEPVGSLPVIAWKLDNSRDIASDEARISIDRIQVEAGSFQQVCSQCGYDETKMKQRFIDLVEKRGKFHNPYTDSGGNFYGKVEAMGHEYEQTHRFKVGDDFFDLVTTTAIPMHIEEIKEIDFNYRQLIVSGYAIVFESTYAYDYLSSTDLKYAMLKRRYISLMTM